MRDIPASSASGADVAQDTWKPQRRTRHLRRRRTRLKVKAAKDGFVEKRHRCVMRLGAPEARLGRTLAGRRACCLLAWCRPVNHRVGGYTDRDRLQAMTTTLSAPRALLMLDPDLGRKLSPEHARMANRALTARTIALRAGTWDSHELFSAVAAGLGLMILDGAIARELWLRDVPSTELFGP